MKKPSTPTLLVLLCMMVQGAWANNFLVTNQNSGGPGSLTDAVQQANAIPTTNDNPHVIDVCSGGEYGFWTLPQQPVIINGPKDNGMTLQGIYLNVGASLKGKHFIFNNITFIDGCCSAFGTGLMSSSGGGTAILNNCRFVNNNAQYQSGGVFNNGDTVILNSCTFQGNYTTNAGGEGGGAVFNNGGFMRITNCTFSNNYSVSQSGTGGGGAVKNHAGGYLEVLNSTFYNNHSASNGGGISNSGNSGTCIIDNNIFVGNTAADGSNDLSGTFGSVYGHNLVGDVTGATFTGVTTGNVYGATASTVLDTVLRNNGRNTWSHALVAGSPAINAADATAAPALDEHDFARIGTPDMGAVEYGTTNPCLTIATTINEPLPGCVPVQNTFSAITTGGAAIIGSYWFDGTNYQCGDTLHHFGNGTFVFTVIDANHCSAKDTVVANYNVFAINHDFTVCPGTPVTYGDSTYTTDGSFLTAYGCDSNVYVNITYQEATEITHQYTICTGDTVFVGANAYTTTGSYANYYGCDSIVYSDVTVTPLTLPTVTVDQTPSCLGVADAQISLSGTAMSVVLNNQTYGIGPQQFWADTVEDVSTEYTTNGSWSAEQTLQAPNTYPSYGDISTAWTPETYGDHRDYIVVGYNAPVTADRVVVYQTNAPGLIDTVFVREASNGVWHKVYTGTAVNGPAVATIFSVNLSGTMAINGVRLEIATDVANDWMEIDAIGLERNQNSVITGLAAGVVSYSVTDNFGCTYQSSTTIADGPQLPLQVTADTAICAGSSVALNVSGASTYAWSTSATTNSITVTPANDATYTVTGTAANGCIGYDTVAVTVNALPQITVNIPQAPFCAGMDTIINLQGGLPAGGVYSGNIVNNNTINLLNALAGNYNITYSYTDANGCSNSGSAQLTIQVCGGILETANTISMDVFPNPAMQQVTVRASDINGKAILRAIDLTGQILLQRQLNASGSIAEFISVAEWPAGMYQIQLTNGSYTATQRLVVAR